MSDATKCKTHHNKPALSFFSATVSAVLFIGTTAMNVLFIIALTRNKSLLKKSLFYKMLLNIAIADLLTALVSDASSVSFHTKEGLGVPISAGEVYLLHVGLFFINGASVLTMTLLCIDRIFALLKPIKYRAGVPLWKSILLIATTWFISGLLIIPYFFRGYIKYLTIFSLATVSITAITLIHAAVIYKRRLRPFRSVSIPAPMKRKGFSKTCNFDLRKKTDNYMATRIRSMSEYAANEPTMETNRIENKRERKQSVSSEKRVNQSFVLMLIVFLVTYLPAAVMTAYMNLCTMCHCMIIHTLRDLTYLSILSSALWRPLNFILRLQTIKKQIPVLFGSKGGTSDKSSTEMSVSGSDGRF